MKKPVRFLTEARLEFNEAADWYEEQRAGVGKKFVGRIRQVIERITQQPDRNAKIYRDVRKAVVPKFPYVVLYQEAENEILVISVFHTSRDPSIWKLRG